MGSAGHCRVKALLRTLKVVEGEEHMEEEHCPWKTPPEGLKTLKPPQGGHTSTFKNPGKIPVKHQAVYPAASKGASPGSGAGGERCAGPAAHAGELLGPLSADNAGQIKAGAEGPRAGRRRRIAGESPARA